ncbi:MAG: DUF421 domain-containing protein [Clostridia bacterium]
MLNITVRTLILYLIIVVVMRIMGKRQIGQLQPFELVVSIMIADLAVIPMENTGIPLINGIIPIITLLFAQITLSYISMKSEKARAIFCGMPTIVIHNGKIQEKELKKLRLNLNDLIEQLRAKDIANISDVEFAILETSGNLSVIPKSQKRAVTPEDLNLNPPYEGIPLSLILDGHVNKTNLATAHLNINWLKDQINQYGFTDVSQVLFASLDAQGKLFIQGKESHSDLPQSHQDK